MRKFNLIFVVCTLLIIVIKINNIIYEINSLYEYPIDGVPFRAKKKVNSIQKIKFILSGKYIQQKRKINYLKSNVWKIDKIIDKEGRNISDYGQSCTSNLKNYFSFYSIENENYVLYNQNKFVKFYFYEGNIIVTEPTPEHFVSRTFKLKLLKNNKLVFQTISEIECLEKTHKDLRLFKTVKIDQMTYFLNGKINY